MRQEHRVDGIAADGERGGAAEHIRPMLELGCREDGLTPGAAAREKLARIPPGSHLQEFPPEDIFQSLRQELGFGREQRRSQCVLPPPLQGSLAIQNV